MTKLKETFLLDVPATDEAGNTYTKHVRLLYRDQDRSMQKRYGNSVIDFGWPCEYYLRNLLRSYPYNHPLCIDAGGRNHNGSPVRISSENMNKVLEKAKPSILYTPGFIIHREIILFGYRLSW